MLSVASLGNQRVNISYETKDELVKWVFMTQMFIQKKKKNSLLRMISDSNRKCFYSVSHRLNFVDFCFSFSNEMFVDRAHTFQLNA